MAREHDARSREVSRLSALADPVRRRLYDYVAGCDTPVRRDAAAAAAGISRTLAAYHLDRLAEAGLLTTSYARPEGRTGPGAGRPAKRYERAHDEVSVTVPPRTYDLLARLLADAVAADATGDVTSAVMATAEREGRAAGLEDADLVTTLRTRAYGPVVTETGDVCLRNCPFHHLAQRHKTLVCALNHRLLQALLSARGEDPGRAELAPDAGACCVRIHPDVT